MCENNAAGDERKQKINSICQAVVQRVKGGKTKEALELLKNGIEEFPDSESLQKLNAQLKQKLIAKKIQKLESDAILLLQSGSEDEAHKRFREILKLDPSRIDLKESLRNTRRENADEFIEHLEKTAKVRAGLYICLAVVIVLAMAISAFVWDNNKHIRTAKQFIEQEKFMPARTELEKCRVLFGGKKKELYQRIETQIAGLVEKADQLAEEGNISGALAAIQKAANGSIDPTIYDSKIEHYIDLQKEQRDQMAQAAEEERQQNDAKYKAGRVKNSCNNTLEKILAYDEDLLDQEVLQKAEVALSEAEQLFSEEKYTESLQKYTEIEALYEETLGATKILEEKREQALAEKLECQHFCQTARDMNGNVEATELMNTAVEMYTQAEEDFENKKYEEALDNWKEAGIKYAEAIDEARISPSYQEAQDRIKKWSLLEIDLEDNKIRSAFGMPNYTLVASDRCVYYYQDMPIISTGNTDEVEVVEPKFGCIVFKDVSYELTRKTIEDAYKAKQEKIKSGYTKSQESNRNSQDKDIVERKRKLDSEYRNSLAKIEEERKQLLGNLSSGMTVLKPIYVVDEWFMPNPNKVASLLNFEKPVNEEKEETVLEWQDPENWRRLKINIRKKDVIKCLGDPTSFDYGTSGKQTFTYGDIPEFGKVILTEGKDGEYRITYWKEPLWVKIYQDPKIVFGKL